MFIPMQSHSKQLSCSDLCFGKRKPQIPIPVDARSKVWVCGR